MARSSARLAAWWRALHDRLRVQITPPPPIGVNPRVPARPQRVHWRGSPVTSGGLVVEGFGDEGVLCLETALQVLELSDGVF